MNTNTLLSPSAFYVARSSFLPFLGVTFLTRNSHYRVTATPDADTAVLVCVAGTFAGHQWSVAKEDIRDLVHVGEAPTLLTVNDNGHHLPLSLTRITALWTHDEDGIRCMGCNTPVGATEKDAEAFFVQGTNNSWYDCGQCLPTPGCPTPDNCDACDHRAYTLAEGHTCDASVTKGPHQGLKACGASPTWARKMPNGTYAYECATHQVTD